MPEKVQGTVKWFSNRKGFGFITPEGDNPPTKEDVFVHQSNIVMEKEGTYRTLKDGMEVQFEVATDDNGKLKAQHVTSADGSPCPIPEPRERRRRKKKTDADTPDGTGAENETAENEGGGKTEETTNHSDKPLEKKGGRNRKRKKNKKGKNNDNNNNNEIKNGNSDQAKSDDGEKKPVRENMESILEPDVKNGLESKQIKIVAGKTFIAIGDARMKLGSGGYAAFGHADGVIAEGNYSFDANGQITVEWQKVLKLENNVWELSTPAAESDSLITDFNLADDNVLPPNGENDTEPIWGEGKADAKEALESNDFMMRNIKFHPTSGGRRRRYGARHTNRKKEEQKSSESA